MIDHIKYFTFKRTKQFINRDNSYKLYKILLDET